MGVYFLPAKKQYRLMTQKTAKFFIVVFYHINYTSKIKKHFDFSKC